MERTRNSADDGAYPPLKETRVSTIAVYGLMPLVLIYIGKIHEIYPMLSRLELVKLSVGAAIILYLFAPRSERDIGVMEFPQTRYILAIFILGILTVPFSSWRRASFDFIILTYPKVLLFFFLLIKVVKTTGDLKKVLTALALAFFALGVAAVTSTHQGRISVGNTYDPNDLAFVIVVGLPIIFFMLTQEKGIKRICLLFTFFLMLAAIIKTASRGGMIGLVTVGAFILIKGMKQQSKLVIPLAVAALLLFSAAPNTFWQRMSSLTNLDEDYNVTETHGRVRSWERGVELMFSNPLLGVGVGSFGAASGKEFDEERGAWHTAHNSFIQIGAELGIGGLLLFIGLLVSSFKSVRAFSTAPEDALPEKDFKWIALGVEGALYGYIVTGFFLSQAYANILLFIIATVIILKKIEMTHEHRSVPESTKSS